MRLTEAEIKARMRFFLEQVASHQRYVTYSTLVEGFRNKPKKGLMHYPEIVRIRAEALEEFNRSDADAGRPFVTSVVLEAGEAMLPRKPYFVALAVARSIEIRTPEQAREAHAREYEAAHAYPWPCKAL